MKRRRTLRSLLVVPIAVLVVTGAAPIAAASRAPARVPRQESEPAGKATTTTTTVVPERVVDVRVGDNFFRPKRIKVRIGTTVRWRNAGRNEHNVLPDKGDAFGIDDLPRGDTYAYRFDEPGKYGYYCSFHGAAGSGQYGTVIVKRAKPPRSKSQEKDREGKDKRDATTTST